MTRIFIRDGLRVGFCVAGQRRFFKANDLDFFDFARNGVEESVFADIEDSNLSRAIAEAKRREEKDGRR